MQGNALNHRATVGACTGPDRGVAWAGPCCKLSRGRTTAVRRWAILALGWQLGWSLEARAALVSLDRSLTASDGAPDAAFGIALANSNGTLLVGAPGRQVGDNVHQGAVYVFTGGGSSFVPQATLYDP